MEVERTSMKAIVLFDTLYGNTEKIANSLAKGLQQTAIKAEYVNIKAIVDGKEVIVDKLTEYDLLVLGAPTQYFTASKPLKEFLERMKHLNLKGKRGFAFDTKLDSRFSGSAAKFIEKNMQEVGIDIIRPRASAIIVCQKEEADRRGKDMLKQGEEEKFRNIGIQLGRTLAARARIV
jgi:flavorubredoxin